jgi:hypothetical protein
MAVGEPTEPVAYFPEPGGFILPRNLFDVFDCIESEVDVFSKLFECKMANAAVLGDLAFDIVAFLRFYFAVNGDGLLKLH